ncbi:MAG: HAMP domain-containing histidine kinase [Lachnospiraceae bacterium]|nr:HAMP domain-containing histidine kinase [Lachnospiraceae bacterium]
MGLCGVFVIVIMCLLLKIYLLKKSAKDIYEQLFDRLTADTNTLIDISGGDKDMRMLANTLNTQLRTLREEHHRFRMGDTELKNAVTNISHDLRTPLTAICGYLDLLAQEDKSEEANRYIEIIQNRTELLKELTEELFRYSVIITTENEMQEEPVVINHMLEESVAAFYTALSERNIIPNIQMPEKKVIRSLDRSALSRVFSNLLNNAIKYSDGDLSISLSENGEIVFENAAPGLNEIQVGKLFDRFYTVEAARKSTGLGLAIARNLVEQMNGTIFARYENNRLRICILFPEVYNEAKNADEINREKKG